MFIDDVTVTCCAGNGGAGCVAFRREKFVPKGGPSGGSGGRGGNIVFIGDRSLTTLLDLRYRKIIKAASGGNGAPKNRTGFDGEDVRISVPVGTVIHDLDNKMIIADITRNGQEMIVCRGGRGGRGNTAFATPRRPAPKICEKGERGETRTIRAELKVLADVGLVGFPNAGKSTLLAAVSAARPKIADYRFTTLVPYLGVVRSGDGRSFVMADLPGLIEGAAEGAGLGFRFLRHIERTRVIVHVVDMAGSEGRDPYQDYVRIGKELFKYDPKLMSRPRIIAANKIDLPEAGVYLKEFKAKLRADNPLDNPLFINDDGEIADPFPVIPISAYTKANLDELLYKISETLSKTPMDFIRNESDETVEYKPIPEPAPFTITRGDDGIFEIEGPKVQKFFDVTDFAHEENVKLLARRLRNLGIDAELRKLGVKHGETVRVLGYEFEFFD